MADPANNALATQPEVWCENPTLENYNPGTTRGQKIFDKVTRGPSDEKLFDDSMENSQKFHSFLRARAAELGPVITRIPVAWKPDGTVQNSRASLTNIKPSNLSMFNELLTTDLQRQLLQELPCQMVLGTCADLIRPTMTMTKTLSMIECMLML